MGEKIPDLFPDVQVISPHIKRNNSSKVCGH